MMITSILTTGDYNFDGYTDFAVVNSHGYGGANVFKDVFLYDKKQVILSAQYEMHAISSLMPKKSTWHFNEKWVEILQ